ncbi:leucine-rich repeat-containing protein 27-like isoform X1 [Conger conger]|uniref:leucine-rich repeat-containing protein 27-like isoform X1 n=2 Tax=Conger conger TaxID=82655 RepID=UPI002A5AA547|nr:leucine-rich repeat-containing protein 27-like isoform X1 [Conger conger]
MASLEQNTSALRLLSTSGEKTPSFPSCSPPENAAETQIRQEVSAETMCLSRRRLKHIEYSILKISAIKHLYLEGNEISILPGTLFSSLPNLVWLDLRNNQLSQLPPEIGQHSVLKTLLLEGNPITELPLELGNLVTLTALSLRHCPIVFPPQAVLCEGVQCILHFLRRAMVERPISRRKAAPALPEVPLMESLQLSSLDCSEDMSDSEEQQTFQRLRHRMMQMERAEFGQGAPGQRAEGFSRGRAPPNTRRKMELPKGTFPDLLLCNARHWTRSEEGRRAATRKMKEKQELLEQRRKDQALLRQWRLEARIRQERGVLESGRRRAEEVLKKAPYATEPPNKMEENAESLTHNALQQEPRKKSLGSLLELDETRVARDKDLEQRIRTHVQMMQERQRRPRGSAREEMEVKMLEQEAAAEQKQEQKQAYRFTAFTGEESP